MDAPSRLAAPATGQCHVWWTRPADAPSGLIEVLDVHERSRRQRLARPADRRRYLTAHALLRVALAGYLECDPAALRFTARCKTCGGRHGKPRLLAPDGGLEVSLSHSGNRVAVGVTVGVPIGVDVEETTGQRDLEAMRDLALSARERRSLDRLAASDRAVGFLRYWTRKEAVLKATGDGLATSPRSVTVSAPDEPARLLGWDSPQRPSVPVQLHDLNPGDGFVGSVALLSDASHSIVEYDGHRLLAGVELPPPRQATRRDDRYTSRMSPTPEGAV